MPQDILNVVAENGEKAIAKAKKSELGRVFEWEDDDGKTHRNKIVEFALVSCEPIAEIHIE